MMSIKAWPFLISRNRYLDYRTVVAPDFISGTTTFLARAVGGDLSEDGQANYREIHNSKDGDMTLIFRVIEANSTDIGEEGSETLKDSFGRAISLIEGIIVQGRHSSILVNQEIFNYVHTEVVTYYRNFWSQMTPETALPSLSFELPNIESYNCLKPIFLEALDLKASSTKIATHSEVWNRTQKLHIFDEVSSLVYSAEDEILAITNRPSLTIWFGDEKTDYFPDSEWATPKFVAHSSDGAEFAICYVSLKISPTTDFIRLWNRKTDKRIDFHAKDRSWVDKITSVAISPDKQLFATCDRNGFIKIWDIRSKMELNLSLTYASCVRSSIFSPDSQLLAIGYEDGTIKLWKPKTGREAYTSNLHKTSVKALAFSPDGQLLVSGDAQGNMNLWSVETLTKRKSFDNAHKLSINSISFNPDGNLIASASDDRVFKLWDVKTFRNIFTCPEQNQSINAVAFGKDGKVLVSGGDGRYVRIWKQNS